MAGQPHGGMSLLRHAPARGMKADTLSAADIASRLAADWTGETIYIDSPIPPEKAVCAAVLVPLFRWQEAWHLLLTRRADHLAQHSGQVAFPGGGCEIGDGGAAATARREAEEEIGLHADDVQVLGQLNPSITITHYHVTPVVGLIPWPYAFRMQTSEVTRIFSMPLDWLAQPRNRLDFVHAASGRTVIAYRPFNGELLWGVTARIVYQFLQTITSPS